MSRGKRQTRLSLAPLDEFNVISNDRLAVNDQSQLASVKYGSGIAPSKSRSSSHTLPPQRTQRPSAPQGTLDMAFARAASRVKDMDGSASQSKLSHSGPDTDSDLSSENELVVLQMSQHKTQSDRKRNTTAFFSPSSKAITGPIVSPRKNPGSEATPRRSSNAIFGPPSSARRSPSEDSGDVIELASRSSKGLRRDSGPSIDSANRHAVLVESSEDEDTGMSKDRGRRSSERNRTKHADEASQRESSSKSSGQSRNQQNEARAVIKVSDAASNTSDNGIDKSPQSTEALPRPRRRLLRGRRHAVLDDTDSDGAPAGDKSTKGRQGVETAQSSDEDAESEVIASSSRKRRRVGTRQESDSDIPRGKRRQEKDDIAEDLDFLRSSSPPRSGPSGRKMSARDERRALLERMKARRAGKETEDGSSNEEEAREEEEDNDVNEYGEGDVSEASNWSGSELHETALDADGDLQGFVEDDGDEPTTDHRSQLPIEMTALAHKSLKEYFAHVVEWMVQNKLNPAFPRDDPLYRLAFRKMNDEVGGYASSKFTSTSWREQFLRAIKARPNFSEEPIVQKGFLDQHCAACGRTSHPATFTVTFSGKAYNPDTLEPLKEDDDGLGDDSDASDDDDDDETSVDYEGHRLPHENHQFHVGRFCKQNAHRAHALTHWRWHLNDWVLDWLRTQGYLDADLLVERERWSTRKRNKYAIRVADDLADKEIANLWRDFKIQLETAKQTNMYGRYER